MAKKAKITAANVMKAMGLSEEKKTIITCGTNDDTIEIAVNPRLTIHARMMMINDILAMLFIKDDNGDVQYHPAVKKFAIDYEIVNYFTNILLPVDTEKACTFLDRTGVAKMIANTVGDGYISDIIAEVNEMIENRKQELLKKSKLDGVLDSVMGVIYTVQKATEGMDATQLLAYVQENIPELKDFLAHILGSELAEAETPAN